MTAAHKWLLLFVDILLYEVDHSNDGQLLSEAADRLVYRYPVLGRALILVAGTIITLHLSNAVPDRLDPMAKNFWRSLIGR
jgi:hypothetical protein